MSLAEKFQPRRSALMRERLRAATEEIHLGLHRAAPFAAIADGTATRETYADTLAFLRRYHGAMAGWCAAGARTLGLDGLARTHRERLAALHADLAVFGRGVPQAEEEPAHHDGFGAGAFAVGVLYTVQGSTLGGKVIYRQLDGLLDGEDGRSFFKGRAGDGHYWRMLCAALEQQSDAAALEAGARHAFARFSDMLAAG
jgi:heme oxygenase